MRKFITFSLILIITFLITGIYETAAFAQGVEPVPLPPLKRRIAVFSFEDKTDYGKENVGDAMADMLTTEMVKSGKYIVIERQQLNAIMQEQQLGMTGAVTPQTAVEVGKLLGVELAVFGVVSEFGQKKSQTGGALKKKHFGIGLDKSTARVAIDVRIVETETGQILAADNVVGEEKKTGLALETYDISFADKSKFDQTMVGKATRKAIEQIISKVDAQLNKTPWSSKVLKVSDGTIYVKDGSNVGLVVGNVFQVYHPGEELIDPDLGISLGSEEKRIGEIQIIDVQEKFSKAIARSGSGFAAGDIIRP
ncbi:MAG: hypothetical protein GF315_03775 [candidate division Zixibacteria bacterium]|nr:hypothetical protein [candidate division Zixibacteria bacterium]